MVVVARGAVASLEVVVAVDPPAGAVASAVAVVVVAVVASARGGPLVVDVVASAEVDVAASVAAVVANRCGMLCEVER